MFEEAIKNLGKRITGRKEVMKSEAAGEPEANEGNDSPLAEELAAQVVVLFETGEVTPDLESVQEWAKGEGLSEEEVIPFAENVVDAYFDVGNEGTGGGDEAGTEEEIEDGEKDMENEELQKSILALQESQAVIASGLTQVLENQEKTLGMTEDISVLKSQLEGVLSRAEAGKEGIVVNKSQAAGTGNEEASMSREETGDLILKSIQAGKLSVNEITFFESTGKASENALKVIKEFQKEVM
ncbi:MAG: hypothetical protein OEY34_00760 [Cyclobacteriaceae bacterium]|nr:hypothetical protein [Cyclobacteriaceae bacterium]